MRKRDAVRIGKAERQFVEAMREQQAAAHRFSLAREAKRRAERELADALGEPVSRENGSR